MKNLKHISSKNVFAANWLFWNPIVLINLVLLLSSGCATHHASVKYFPWAGKLRLTSKPLDCRASTTLLIRQGGERFKTDAQLKALLKGPRSELDLLLLNPWKTPFAKFKLGPDVRLFIQGGEEQSPEANEWTSRWSQGEWWEKLSFLFGLPPSSKKSRFYTNEHGQFVFSEFDDQKMRCEYASTKVGQPNVCFIEAERFTVRLDIAIAECQETLD